MVSDLADDPNYEYDLVKLTIGPETIRHIFPDSWVAHLIVVRKL